MAVKSVLRLALVLLVTIILQADCVLSEHDYDYGDPDIQYNQLEYDNIGEPVVASARDKGSVVKKPLCCPMQMVYDGMECISPPPGFSWKPSLDGSINSLFEYSGFPSCHMKTNYIETYQKEVHFDEKKATAFLPYYIQLLPVAKEKYCIAKIYDGGETNCVKFQTKVFTCLTKENDSKALLWISVTIAHIMVFLTLLTYFLMSDLRCLQGQYMICFLISLFIYNLCLYPGSKLSFDVSDVSCIALGAVKYFFFCGIFLWFNTICFDIWRTLSNRQDISGRRRFLLYSAYSWIIGAILTTVVLVLPYMRDGTGSGSRDDPLKDESYEHCKLKFEMNMILLIAQLLSLVIDLVFLILSTCAVCNYTKFGNGLPRFDASLSLKQGWKLFFIMIAHMMSSVAADIIKFPVPLWLYVLLESSAIFGVFAYRQSILKKLSKKVCRSDCVPVHESGSLHEKNQLTMT